ncbi:MAG TPA: hypothetical protein ENN30_02560 [Candidatus Woesearchaeota archaeon]|nr:hypothetical protein [Candidatus Woesearchaeota archaeon]
MEIKIVKLQTPADANMILGQSHFIKTVEDLYEAIIQSVPDIKFGIAFCEASGPRLIRHDGNDEELEKAAVENAKNIGAGHSFIIFMRGAFPINLMRDIRQVPEVVNIFCATANPVEVVVAESELGRGILGVIDGESPLDVENMEQVQERKDFLRKIGYKK